MKRHQQQPHSDTFRNEVFKPCYRQQEVFAHGVVWWLGCALAKGGVLVRHHDPANRVLISVRMPSIARAGPLDRRSDQPGTGDGNNTTAAHLVRWFFLPQKRLRNEDQRRSLVGSNPMSREPRRFRVRVAVFNLNCVYAVNPPPGRLVISPISLPIFLVDDCLSLRDALAACRRLSVAQVSV
jgi:hypothetical protein